MVWWRSGTRKTTLTPSSKGFIKNVDVNQTLNQNVIVTKSTTMACQSFFMSRMYNVMYPSYPYWVPTLITSSIRSFKRQKISHPRVRELWASWRSLLISWPWCFWPPQPRLHTSMEDQWPTARERPLMVLTRWELKSFNNSFNEVANNTISYDCAKQEHFNPFNYLFISNS